MKNKTIYRKQGEEIIHTEKNKELQSYMKEMKPALKTYREIKVSKSLEYPVIRFCFPSD